MSVRSFLYSTLSQFSVETVTPCICCKKDKLLIYTNDSILGLTLVAFPLQTPSAHYHSKIILDERKFAILSKSSDIDDTLFHLKLRITIFITRLLNGWEREGDTLYKIEVVDNIELFLMLVADRIFKFTPAKDRLKPIIAKRQNDKVILMGKPFFIDQLFDSLREKNPIRNIDYYKQVRIDQLEFYTFVANQKSEKDNDWIEECKKQLMVLKGS